VSINGVAYAPGGGGGSGGDVSANSSFGTTALSAVVVGNSARTLTLNGSTVNTPRLQLLGSANNTGIEFINTTTTQSYDINIASWGDLNMSGNNSAGTIFSYSPTNSLLRSGGNSTTKTRVLGSLAVSTNDAFIGTQLLHVDGNAKINGDLTIGTPSSVFSGLIDLAEDTAPTSLNANFGATASSLTRAYNRAVSLIPALSVICYYISCKFNYFWYSSIE
jgi:hypothetical protein